VYTVAEAAKFLRVSRRAVYRMIERGEIASPHVGRAVRVPVVAVQRLPGHHI
jgi:excisionase family DNA binding protein